MRALRQLVSVERPDLIHAWDWWQSLDAFYGVHLTEGTPLLVSHMMMDLTRLLPRHVPTTYGTRWLRDAAQLEGREPVALLMPPTDVQSNSPDAIDPAALRQEMGIEPTDITVVTVSRLHTALKAESLLATVAAIGRIGRNFPVRFIIVGDGDLRSTLEAEARRVNECLGRTAVTLIGEMLDPRPAYAAADIVVAMGGSALRGMAFAKPVIVVGEKGFAELMSPETAAYFDQNGLYGRGVGDLASRLADVLCRLCEQPDQFPSVGAFSRQFVTRHYSLESVADHLIELYGNCISRRTNPRNLAFDALRTAYFCLAEGRLVPYWSLRRAYHDLGGPPVFPLLRTLFRTGTSPHG
jgi:glycosyltransferase involved in cell wall biosynthesis